MFEPGWLLRDVRRASARVAEWSTKTVSRSDQPMLCEKCGNPTEHICSWVCVEYCQHCADRR